MSDTRAAVEQFLRSGVPPRQVATALGIPVSRVYAEARAVGLNREDWAGPRDKRMLELYRSGASLMEVATTCGVSWSTAQKVVATAKIPRPRGQQPRGPGPAAQEIICRVANGEPVVEVAKTAGVSPQYVYRVVKRWGVAP